MDEKSLARTAPPGIPPDRGDHARLLDAAREALALLDRIDRHAPEGLTFGGESRVRRMLREAIRLASFELRPCADCEGRGVVPGRTAHPMQRSEPAECPQCGGCGEVRVFAYAPPKSRRRR